MKTRLKDVWHFLANTRNYCPQFNPPFRYILTSKWDLVGRIDTLFCPTKILDKHQLFVNERILELPFVHRVLDSVPDSRILEFGCTNSKLCIELASRGMMVSGVDLRPYSLTHPNFTFYQGDFFETEFSEAPFDAIIAVSAVEHVGLGTYGEEMRDDSGLDYRLAQAFYHLLQPEGQLILTFPFGKSKITPHYRIYDGPALRALLRDYTIEATEYYRRVDYCAWMPASENELNRLDWNPVPTGTGAEGVACIAARRT